MNAWVLHDIGDIRYEEREKPVPHEDEVLLRVMAVGVCGSDIPRIYETGAHVMPLIPGHEFAGMVEETGTGVDPAWKGKRVGVFPLIPCSECEPCRKKQYELCRNYDYIGSRRDGAFAEYVCAPADNLIELPDEMSYEAAAMLEPMSVSVHAIRMGLKRYYASHVGLGTGRPDETAGGVGTNVPAGESHAVDTPRIAVCGMGTIGLLVIAFLKDMGYDDLYVIGNKDFQFDKAADLGVPRERMINGRSEDVVSRLHQMCGGPDIYMECVGKNECFSWGVEAAAPFGVVVAMGNPYGDMKLDRDVYWKILRNQLTIVGTWNSSFPVGEVGSLSGCGGTGGSDDDWHYVVNRVSDGGVRPEELITHRLALDELEQGLKVMRDKSEEYVKVMVVGDSNS